MDRISRAGLAAVFGFALTLVAGAAGAVTFPKTPDSIKLKASEGVSIGTRAGQWEFAQALDGATAKAAFSVNLPKGPAVSALLTRAITKQMLLDTALAGARLIGPVGLAVSIAPVVWDAINGFRVPAPQGQGYLTSLAPSPAFPYPSGTWNAPNFCKDTPYQGASDKNTWGFVVCQATSPGPGWNFWMKMWDSGAFNFQTNAWTLYVPRTSQLASCLADPANVLLFSTGGCSSDIPRVPATDDDIRQGYASGYDADPDAAVKIARWANANSVPMQSADAQTSGPAHVIGQAETETSTTDAGTTTTTKQHDYDLGYSGTDVSVAEKVTETTTDPTGVTTVKTTTSTVTGDGPTPPPNQPPDPCVDHPDASGCAPFGDVSDSDLEQQDMPVTFAYSSVAGSCPAPKAMSFLGQPFEWSYDGPCSFARGIRPIVIALALLGALWLIIKVGHG